jgi:hypothetical protein
MLLLNHYWFNTLSLICHSQRLMSHNDWYVEQHDDMSGQTLTDDTTREGRAETELWCFCSHFLETAIERMKVCTQQFEVEEKVIHISQEIHTTIHQNAVEWGIACQSGLFLSVPSGRSRLLCIHSVAMVQRTSPQPHTQENINYYWVGLLFADTNISLSFESRKSKTYR